jgi:lysophospholipase L1-like esterase
MKRHIASILMGLAATASHAAAPTSTSAAASVGGAAANAGFRFDAEIDAFARRALPAHDATLFLGSSSIRLWDVSHSFPEVGAINRGFGGATVKDVLHYYPRIIAGAQPESVVVYVGENDIAAGAAPDSVAADILILLRRIRADFPEARIAYLSMKPSPSRWTLWPNMIATNRLVRAGAAATFDYLDVGSSMLTRDGHADEALYGPDGLHMNARGYAKWTSAVDAYLDAAGTIAAAGRNS